MLVRLILQQKFNSDKNVFSEEFNPMDVIRLFKGADPFFVMGKIQQYFTYLMRQI